MSYKQDLARYIYDYFQHEIENSRISANTILDDADHWIMQAIHAFESTSGKHYISAAPQMLEALVFAKERLENMSTADFEKGADADIRTKLDLAIAAAEGKE